MIIKNPVTRIFQLLLLVSPIAISADVNMDTFDLIFFRTGIIFLFASALMDTAKRAMPGYVNRIIFSLLGLCLFNIFVHKFHITVLANTMNLFLAIIGICALYTYLDEKSNLAKYILWAGLVNLVFAMAQKMGFDPIFEQIPYGMPSLAGSFFGNNPRIANYFALIVPLLPLAYLPVGLIALFFTKQFVILIPLVIIFLVRLKTARLKVGFLVIVIIFVSFFRDHIIQSFTTRFNVWAPALKAFFDRSFIGYGIGIRVIPDADALFNSYLSFVVGTGILGLVWFGYVFKNIYKRLDNSVESIALISLLVIMMVEYPIEIPRLWYLIIGIIVMWLIKNDDKEVANA